MPKTARESSFYGADVRRLRLSTGCTQAEMAKELGVHAVTVSLWETGKTPPPPHSLRCFAIDHGLLNGSTGYSESALQSLLNRLVTRGGGGSPGQEPEAKSN